MPEPAEHLLATLHSCEERWNIFGARIRGLALQLWMWPRHVPSNRYQHSNHCFIRAAVKWTTDFHKLSGYTQNLMAVLTTMKHTLLRLHCTGLEGTIQFGGQWYWRRSFHDRHAE